MIDDASRRRAGAIGTRTIERGLRVAAGIAAVGWICSIAGDELGRGFALGFGVGGGFGFVFEQVVGAHEGEGFCVGLDEVGAGGVDALHARLGALEVG